MWNKPVISQHGYYICGICKSKYWSLGQAFNCTCEKIKPQQVIDMFPDNYPDEDEESENEEDF